MRESKGRGSPEGRRRGKAVALRYLPEVPAPFIVAKGEGRTADRIMELAREAGVPVLREDGLTEALFPLELGDCVPVDLYEIMAKVFAFVRLAEE
jgi:flagellar biosynthesis protein